MTQPHAPTVAVAGATGLIGQALLSRLAGDVRARDVHALARRPPAEHGAVQWHDWEWLNLPDALPALDLAFCCLGTTRRQAGSRDAFEAVDHALVLRFARAMRAAGVRNFSVVSSAGASARAASHYLRVKRRTEQDLSALGFDALYIHRPSLLLGERAERRLAEELAQKLAPLLSSVIPRPFARYRPILAGHVADGMIEAAFSGRPGTKVHYPSVDD